MIEINVLKVCKHANYGTGCLFFEEPISKFLTCCSDGSVTIHEATNPYKTLKRIEHKKEGEVNQAIRWNKTSFLIGLEFYGIRGYSIIPPFRMTKAIPISGLFRFQKIDHEQLLGIRRNVVYRSDDKIVIISYENGKILKSLKSEFSNTRFRISSVFSNSFYYNWDDESLLLINTKTMSETEISPPGFESNGRFIGLDVIEPEFKRNEDTETIAVGGYGQTIHLINCQRNNNNDPEFTFLKAIKLKEIHHNDVNLDYKFMSIYFLKFIQNKYITVCSGGGGFIIELDLDGRKKKIEEYYSKKYEPKKEDKNLELTMYRTKLHSNGIWDLKVVNSLSNENRICFLSASFDKTCKFFYLTGLELVDSNLKDLEKKDLKERIEWLRNENEGKEFLRNSLVPKEKIFQSMGWFVIHQAL